MKDLIRKRTSLVALTMASLGLMTSCTWDHVEPDVCFATEIQPMITSHCSTVGCHNPTDREKGYDFTSYNGIMAAVTPGRPGNSEFYQVLNAGGDDRMPPAGYPQLTSEQIATVQAWIKSGADNTQNCGSSASCDTTAAVSYSADLQPFLQNNCGGCHSGGTASAGLDLTVYATVKTNAESWRIQASLLHEVGFAAMPPNSPPLSSCYANQLDRWVAAGAPNN